MTPISPLSSASNAACGSTVGPIIGFASHHASPASACASVALFVALLSFPAKRDGGGGSNEVSGTAACQSW